MNGLPAPAVAPGCPRPGRSHRTHRPGHQPASRRSLGHGQHLPSFIPVTNPLERFNKEIGRRTDAGAVISGGRLGAVGARPWRAPARCRRRRLHLADGGSWCVPLEDRAQELAAAPSRDDVLDYGPRQLARWTGPHAGSALRGERLTDTLSIKKPQLREGSRRCSPSPCSSASTGRPRSRARSASSPEAVHVHPAREVELTALAARTSS